MQLFLILLPNSRESISSVWFQWWQYQKRLIKNELRQQRIIFMYLYLCWNIVPVTLQPLVDWSAGMKTVWV